MTEDDVHYSADGEPLAVQARRLVVENQRLTEKLRRLEAAAGSPGGEDELREALAEALNGVEVDRNDDKLTEREVDALLPVVLADRERHARQRAAEELRAAADSHMSGWVSTHGLRNRAAALTCEATP